MTIQNTQGSSTGMEGLNVGALSSVIGIPQLTQMYTQLYTSAVEAFGAKQWGYTHEQIVDNADRLMVILWPRFVAGLQGTFGSFLGQLTLGNEGINANVRERLAG